MKNDPNLQLLDVRQPKEYEKGHIPGALLIPLSRLPQELDRLDRSRPLLVYCAVGGRSRTATLYLAGQGFSRVFNLKGGIKAWDGPSLDGVWEQGFDLIPPDAGYAHGVQLALNMEIGLRDLYIEMLAREGDPALKEIFSRLAQFEKGHIELLMNLLSQEGKDPLDGNPNGPKTVEGGKGVRQRLKALFSRSMDPQRMFEAAMSVELSAMDLYQRLSLRATAKETKGLFERLSREEMGHLRFLEKEMDRYI